MNRWLVVCDNLKTGVDKPDLYDPQINRCYAELAVHYGNPHRPGTGIQTQGQGLGFTLHLLRWVGCELVF
jgi:hypothetical protein